MPDRTPTVSDYFSLVKISHTIFSLPFALIGFSIALNDNKQRLDIRILLMILLCIFFARNAAMGFNRFVDREFDKKNPRTAFREIPKNIIRPTSALLFVLLNAFLFMGSAFMINTLCFFLSPVALLVILGYSFTKRFTFLSHLILGLGLALAPVGAYLAVTASFSLLPVLFSLIVIFWVAGFDIIYSLQDFEFDKNEQLKSVPETFGKTTALIVSGLCHTIAIGFVVIAGIYGDFRLLYWIGASVFALILLYEHLIVKPHDLSKVNMAFATMNGMASVIFAIFVMADVFLK
jgi:4-hydroxybenzoate polyprenyltransferase